MRSQRPTGVTILAIVFGILGLLSFFWALFIFGVGAVTGLTGSIFGAENMASFGGSNVWAGVLGMAGAVFNLIVAFGLFTLKPWAWLLALIAVGINVVQGVLGLFGGGMLGICCGLIGLIIPAGILFYLLRPEIKKAFGR
jgi:hypothetical protein